MNRIFTSVLTFVPLISTGLMLQAQEVKNLSLVATSATASSESADYPVSLIRHTWNYSGRNRMYLKRYARIGLPTAMPCCCPLRHTWPGGTAARGSAERR